MNKKILCLLVAVGSVCVSPMLRADVVPLAIFPFDERGPETRGMGSAVSDLLFAELVSDPEIFIVERAQLNKAADELSLNLSGAVAQDQALAVGRLIGARVLVLGSVIDAGSSLHIVARMVGTETSRVLGESVKGRSDVDVSTLIEELGQKIRANLKTRADELLPPVQSTEDRIASINAQLGTATRPSVAVKIAERHVGQSNVDPAAQTELERLLVATGFNVLDASQGLPGDADIYLTGEGFSEYGIRRGELLSVKARVEIKAVVRETGAVLASEAEQTVSIDVSEHIAGKTALEEAAARIAERMLPRLAVD
ncbi:MAG TPA: CsgG/HfaB family protein [Kiritimatiellia bacterium]|nr:CsgG/HfaB family protein [Kiritimatiellia bacterium]